MDPEAPPSRPPWEDAPEDAPVEPAPGRSQRPLVAGVLLLFLVGLGLFQGISNLVLDYDAGETPLRTDSRTFAVEGTVLTETGQPAAGANVTSTLDRKATVTDANGSYRLEGIPAGYLELSVTAEGHGNTTVRAVLLRDETLDATLGPAGDDRVVEHESLSWQTDVVRILGATILVLTGVVAAGAVAAYRRRPRWLAIVGAVAGFFVGLPLSIVIAPGALILLARSRKDFA